MMNSRELQFSIVSKKASVAEVDAVDLFSTIQEQTGGQLVGKPEIIYSKSAIDPVTVVKALLDVSNILITSGFVTIVTTLLIEWVKNRASEEFEISVTDENGRSMSLKCRRGSQDDALALAKKLQLLLHVDD